MADANDNDPDVELTGPSQRGRGVHGQYVYWICMQHPKPETVQRTGVKTLADFDGPTFREMFVKSHQECGIEIEETTCFKEPNENGLFHLNLLVRGRRQHLRVCKPCAARPNCGAARPASARRKFC